MNRKERRANKIKPDKYRTVEVPIDNEYGICDGDLVTIKGYKFNSDGTIITNCESRSETVWKVKLVKEAL